jgi:uncharacterized protein
MAEVKQAQTVEEKLRALYSLQVVHSKIDKIRIVRGELPLEVEDLEDEIEGLKTRASKIEEDVNGIEQNISDKKNFITDAKAAIKKYEGQQEKVRNNREYEALGKEIEFQQLEIQLTEKKINELKVQATEKKAVLEGVQKKIEDRSADLDAKKAELDEIIAETEREESILLEIADSLAKNIEERLLTAYSRIRNASKNGMAVVPIDREASAGSFIKIPPQRQLDVAARKKIIVDEHSGRVLVDQVLAQEETERIENLTSKKLKS